MDLDIVPSFCTFILNFMLYCNEGTGEGIASIVGTTNPYNCCCKRGVWLWKILNYVYGNNNKANVRRVVYRNNEIHNIAVGALLFGYKSICIHYICQKLDI